MLGNTRGSARWAYISDGGHFENLGIYELVRRRCRFIMCADASADPDRDFASLGNAIHKCRVDFGVEIDIDVSRIRPDAKTGRSAQTAVLGKIDYGNGDSGVLLYMKPCLVGDEPPDIANYASEHSEFPHEPTSDQFFDERQFESYRHLGFVSCRRVLAEAAKRVRGASGASGANVGSDRPIKLDEKERFLVELRHRLFEPSDAIALHFSRHGEALDRLFTQLRSDEHLKPMDAYLFPGWPSASHAASLGYSAMPAPGSDEFRACFYFVQEQIQLMEAVYVDLDLEKNWNHPDNRGWMNSFRQWVWAPVFRLAWAISGQMRGARFVRFCESRLYVPDVVGALTTNWIGHQSLDALADCLRRDGCINELEFQLLKSQALADHCAEHWHVCLLQIDWGRVFRRSRQKSTDERTAASDPPNLGVGFALVKGNADEPRTIVIFRVQDHLRRLGLGAAFMRKIVRKAQNVRTVESLSGDFGPIGRISNANRDRQQLQLLRMLKEARYRLQ